MPALLLAACSAATEVLTSSVRSSCAERSAAAREPL